jgi:hypothetical protein
MTSREMGFWYWVISHLIPKKIIYFSFMHVMAYATTGKYGNTVVPEITGMDAIKRYGDDNDLWAPPR